MQTTWTSDRATISSTVCVTTGTPCVVAKARAFSGERLTSPTRRAPGVCAMACACRPAIMPVPTMAKPEWEGEDMGGALSGREAERGSLRPQSRPRKFRSNLDPESRSNTDRERRMSVPGPLLHGERIGRIGQSGWRWWRRPSSSIFLRCEVNFFGTTAIMSPNPPCTAWPGSAGSGVTRATEQYYPLLHSFFWLQHALWGDHPLGYRLVSLGLHAASGVLFGLFLKRLMGPGAWVAALLFAPHPVHVESVAWIAEQKIRFRFFLSHGDADLPAIRRNAPFAILLCGAGFFPSVPGVQDSHGHTARGLAGGFLVEAGPARMETRWETLVPWLVLGAGCGLFSGLDRAALWRCGSGGL